MTQLDLVPSVSQMEVLGPGRELGLCGLESRSLVGPREFLLVPGGTDAHLTCPSSRSPTAMPQEACGVLTTWYRTCRRPRLPFSPAPTCPSQFVHLEAWCPAGSAEHLGSGRRHVLPASTWTRAHGEECEPRIPDLRLSPPAHAQRRIYWGRLAGWHQCLGGLLWPKTRAGSQALGEWTMEGGSNLWRSVTPRSC